MRKVLFKKWIPLESKPIDILSAIKKHEIVEGTSCMSDFINEGVFHQWSLGIETSGELRIIYNGNSLIRTIGIIETEDGTIEEVLPSNIKFISN